MIILAVFESAMADSSKNTVSTLARNEAIQLAEEKAKSEGIDLLKYNMTGCHYAFLHKDHTWSVFFEMKPPTPPGGHFIVTVDDRTKTTTLMYGE
jgi:hypothetical protein